MYFVPLVDEFLRANSTAPSSLGGPSRTSGPSRPLHLHITHAIKKIGEKLQVLQLDYSESYNLSQPIFAGFGGIFAVENSNLFLKNRTASTCFPTNRMVVGRLS
jgi:hypothetical protein